MIPPSEEKDEIQQGAFHLFNSDGAAVWCQHKEAKRGNAKSFVNSKGNTSEHFLVFTLVPYDYSLIFFIIINIIIKTTQIVWSHKMLLYLKWEQTSHRHPTLFQGMLFCGCLSKRKKRVCFPLRAFSCFLSIYAANTNSHHDIQPHWKASRRSFAIHM